MRLCRSLKKIFFSYLWNLTFSLKYRHTRPVAASSTTQDHELSKSWSIFSAPAHWSTHIIHIASTHWQTSINLASSKPTALLASAEALMIAHVHMQRCCCIGFLLLNIQIEVHTDALQTLPSWSPSIITPHPNQAWELLSLYLLLFCQYWYTNIMSLSNPFSGHPTVDLRHVSSIQLGSHLKWRWLNTRGVLKIA